MGVVLYEFDKSIVDYPSIQRSPGGASNDNIPDLQHPKNPLPADGFQTHADGPAFKRLTGSFNPRACPFARPFSIPQNFRPSSKYRRVPRVSPIFETWDFIIDR